MNGAAERSWEGDPIRGRARALAPLLVVLSLVLGGLSGCVLLRDDPPGASAPTSAAPPPPGVIEDLKRVLRRRAVAVREDRARQFRAGLAAFTKLFADKYAADNVRMNNVLPGFISSLPEKEDRRARIPMGRYGTVEEVAELILFLASEKSSYMTGQNLRIDGGITRSV